MKILINHRVLKDMGAAKFAPGTKNETLMYTKYQNKSCSRFIAIF